MSPSSPGAQREGEEGGEWEPKRRKLIDHPRGGEPKKGTGKRTGRPRNNRGLPRRDVRNPVPIIPRPSLVPEGEILTSPTHGIDISQDISPPIPPIPNTFENISLPDPTVTNIPPPVSETLIPATSLVPPPQPFITPVPLSHVVQPGLARRGRGHQPINPNKLHRAERAMEMKLMTGDGIVTFENAIASPHYPESFMNPITALIFGLEPVDLPPSDIKRISTPRGWLRCTRTVILYFSLPQLGHDEFDNIRVLVLDDEHPDIGVPIIMGRPWIHENPFFRKYVYENGRNVYASVEDAGTAEE